MKTILLHVFFLLVIHHEKVLCADEGCGNGNSSKLILAEMQQLFRQIKGQLDTVMASLQAVDRRSQEQDISFKEVQNIQSFLNASFQEIQIQHDVVLRNLEANGRRLHEHDISMRNETQNSWKLTIGFPVKLQISIDLGEGPVPLPIVGSWIVLMHRFDGSVDFNRNWIEYKNGFGDMTQGEFWLGNEKIHRLTNRLVYTLRIEVQFNATGVWYHADYATFSLDSENNKYALRLSRFIGGNAGDSLTNTTLRSTHLRGFHGGMSFSTWDADNDRHAGNCASHHGGGWWYEKCQAACLTCLYKSVFFQWSSLEPAWASYPGQLSAARMMIRGM